METVQKLQACGVSHFYFKLRAFGLGCGSTCFSIHFSLFFSSVCVQQIFEELYARIMMTYIAQLSSEIWQKETERN